MTTRATWSLLISSLALLSCAGGASEFVVHDTALVVRSDAAFAHSTDLPLRFDAIRGNLIADLERLAPFGLGNPRPVFSATGVELAGALNDWAWFAGSPGVAIAGGLGLKLFQHLGSAGDRLRRSRLPPRSRSAWVADHAGRSWRSESDGA